MDEIVKGYIDYFKKNKDIYICCKTIIKDNHVAADRFYVYAHGGILCMLPKENCVNSNMILFDLEYIKYIKNQKVKEHLKEEYHRVMKKNSSERFSFIKNNLDELITMMSNRAEGSLCEDSTDRRHEHKERQRETKIARLNHDMDNGYVVCDMEYCISLKGAGNSMQDTDLPKADLVAVLIDSDGIVNIVYMEYKCTNSGLKGVSLAKHYRDMKKYALNNEEGRNHIVRLSQETVIYRYNKMVEYELLSGERVDLAKEKVDSKIVFLVTHIDEIRGCLLKNYNELLTSIEAKDRDRVMFVQNRNEDIVLSQDRFASDLDLS